MSQLFLHCSSFLTFSSQLLLYEMRSSLEPPGHHIFTLIPHAFPTFLCSLLDKLAPMWTSHIPAERVDVCVVCRWPWHSVCTCGEVTPFHRCLPVDSVLHTSPSPVPVFKLALTWCTAILLPGSLIFWIDEGPWTPTMLSARNWLPLTSWELPAQGVWNQPLPAALLVLFLAFFHNGICLNILPPFSVCEDLIPCPTLSEISSRRHPLHN